MIYRPRIPARVQDDVLYRNAHNCCVCRAGSNSVQFHHIDGNRRNNAEANIAVLCAGCHDNAHSVSKLSQNLSPARVRYAKRCWEAEVSKSSSKEMLPKSSWQKTPVWTYVNHERLPQVFSSSGVTYNQVALRRLQKDGLVNQLGISLPVIEPETGSGELITVYDRIPYEHRARLIKFYSDGIKRLIMRCSPIDMQQFLRKSQVRSVVRPGDLCYANRGFHFRSQPVRPNGTQRRFVQTSFAGVSIKFQVDTRFMYGNSSWSNSFAGHRIAAALLLVKSMNSEQGKLVLHCTPLAMGTGFLRRNKPRHRVF